MALKKCLSLEEMESRANFRLEPSVQKNSCPTVEFDTSVVHHSNTLRKIWLEVKWPTTFSGSNGTSEKVVLHYLFR